ncbi:RNA polymerase sigma-70 factor, sigma-E family [Nakamurella panacisegetis]|uniref:RNA polymerase sigma-70 factor, sigma-E family n=1 Tax=Nakamurella panacisegetis TaxID=1090615 RepID=A0A1H0JUC0_9ACTN|nr:SigE family RNA polymerase sigma factor [Nakamurella panacisegetis]SDO47011.1 RNA polymerase sigma-70 factor, sigma-E family [Nakamurella panacisegetis]
MTVDDQWAESAVERTLGTLARLNPDFPPAAQPEPPSSATLPGATATPAGPAPARTPVADVTIDDIYRTHRMGMVRLAILLVDDQASAEDVVQEAFAGLFRNWAGLRDNAAAIGYLRTAVVNGSRSMLRRRRTARAYVPPHPGTERSAESLALLTAEHQAVVTALADLAPRQREVLVLRYYGGLSEAEIAEATGLSKGTVKSTASRAVAKLGDIMRAR